MNRIIFSSLIILFSSVLFNSCKKEASDPIQTETEVEFSFSIDQLKTNKSQGLTGVVVTIEDLQGNVIKNSEKIDIYNMNGSYISEPISLLTGNYKLTRFLVLNSSNDVVYASPVEGSDKANLVENPLPLEFSAQKDETTKTSPEVLSTNDSQPEDFGYTTFSFEIAETFDILVGAFVYNETIQNYELTTADINIKSGEVEIYSGTLGVNTNDTDYYDSTGVTTKISLPEKYETFTINISKDGYNSYNQAFSKEELRLYYRDEDKGPLVVVLEEGCWLDTNQVSISVSPVNLLWPSNTVYIENLSVQDADSYKYDFGDGTTLDQSSYVASISHAYDNPGTYQIQLTVSKNGCIGTTKKVIAIYSNSVNDSISAGEDQTVVTDTTTLDGRKPILTTGEWTVLSGSGIFADPTDPKTKVSNLQPGLNTFRWTVTIGNETIFDDVTINYLGTSANAGLDQIIGTDTTFLNASAPSQGTGIWSVVSGSGIFANPNNPITKVSGIGVGDNIYRWTVTYNGISSSDDVKITSIQINASAGLDQIISTNTTFLYASNPSPGIGIWSIVSGSGTFEDANSPTTKVSGIGTGTNIYRWTVTYNGIMDFDDVSITLNP